MRRQWTTEETDYLKDKYGVMKDKTIANKLNRSVDSVTNKAQKMGLRKNDFASSVTVADFCYYTNINRSSVEYWIKHCQLPTRKKERYRTVNIDSFWKWAEQNKGRIDWNDFPYFAMGKEPKWVDVARKNNVARTDKRRRWKSWEIAELKRMLKSDKYNYSDISKRINRNHAAIKRKIYDLRLDNTPITTNKKNKYSETDIKIAITLLEKGVSLSAAAQKINRTEAGLRAKLENEGYVFKNKCLKVE